MSTEAQTQADLMKRVNRKTVEEGINGRNVDAFDEAYSQTCVWHGPGGREITGLDGFKEMVSGYLTAFPDLKMTIEHQVAEGNTLATHWIATGTNTGPLGDFPPTGKTSTIHGHIILRFEKGTVVEEFEVFDELHMLQQRGLAGS